ncbi:hypothetical protein, partial [Ligilactobacillus hayakitensis]|uniref:hypothetical protein n=1 Tax=Ligilactobacillus hayakitensis TaxID=396716 RepID=UPI000AA69BC7
KSLFESASKSAFESQSKSEAGVTSLTAEEKQQSNSVKLASEAQSESVKKASEKASQSVNDRQNTTESASTNASESLSKYWHDSASTSAS